jgi:hypothetical protein
MTLLNLKRQTHRTIGFYVGDRWSTGEVSVTIERHAIENSIDVPSLDEWFDSPLSVIAEKIAVLGSTFKIFFAVFWAGLSALEGTKYEFIVFKCQMGNDLLTDIKSDEDGPAMRASIEVYVIYDQICL